MNSKKKWNIGDIFALEIKNCNDKEYNGKFLIFNKIGTTARNRSDTNVVRVKLADNIHENMTKSEIDSFEYINISFFMIEEWTHYISSEELPLLKKHINDFNMVLLNVLELVFPKRNLSSLLSDFIYIGNFELDPPNNEFIPANCENISYLYLGINDISNYVIERYKSFNLKESPVFTSEYSDYLNEIARGDRIITERALRTYSEIENNKISKEETENLESLTYVGK